MTPDPTPFAVVVIAWIVGAWLILQVCKLVKYTVKIWWPELVRFIRWRQGGEKPEWFA